MISESLSSLSFLDGLHSKVQDLLEFYTNPLLQVLRYRDEGWFVPSEIEIPVKYIIKNYHDFSGQHVFSHRWISYCISKKSEHTFKILEPWLVRYIDIQKNSLSMDAYGSYRSITYRGKVFEDLWRSGNTYYHTLSQREKINERVNIDREHGDFTLEDEKKIHILNDFHDIPEKEKGDIICSSKTDKHRQEESIIAQNIIDETNWWENEKQMMRDILLHEHSKSIFKLYEKMMYIIDIQHLMEHANSYNKVSPLIGFMLWFQIPSFLQEYEFINGIKKPALEIASCKQHFQKFISVIDDAFVFVRNNGMDIGRQHLFERAYALWNNKIRPLL